MRVVDEEILRQRQAAKAEALKRDWFGSIAAALNFGPNGPEEILANINAARWPRL
jgi:hypothetical protein